MQADTHSTTPCWACTQVEKCCLLLKFGHLCQTLWLGFSFLHYSTKEGGQGRIGVFKDAGVILFLRKAVFLLFVCFVFIENKNKILECGFQTRWHLTAVFCCEEVSHKSETLARTVSQRSSSKSSTI